MTGKSCQNSVSLHFNTDPASGAEESRTESLGHKYSQNSVSLHFGTPESDKHIFNVRNFGKQDNRNVLSNSIHKKIF